jgi:hypothetical protein
VTVSLRKPSDDLSQGFIRAAARVQRGAEKLDEGIGGDWHDSIDLLDFDITSLSDCILGQLYRDEVREPWQAFGRGMVALFGEDDDNFETARFYGFDGDTSEYVDLQDAWNALILSRRS